MLFCRAMKAALQLMQKNKQNIINNTYYNGYYTDS